MFAIRNEKKLNCVNQPIKILITFLVSFFTVFIFSCVSQSPPLMFDAQDYDFLSSSFTSSGEFHLSNYPADTIRGAIFPLCLSICKQIFLFFSINEIYGWRLLISTAVASIVVLMPYLFACYIKTEPSVLRRLMPLALILIFWYGLILSPVSDFMALTFLILGMAFLSLVFRTYQNTWQHTILFSFLSGAFLYAAYNTRTIYLFPAVLFVSVFLLHHRKAGKRVCLLTGVGVCLGIMALGSIQGYINLLHHESFSLSVFSNNLYLFQITAGMSLAQYETYQQLPGAVQQYPSPALAFVDQVGISILKKEGAPSSIIGAIGLILKYPFDFVGIYGRHFINMLNPVWGGGVYITNLNAIKIHLSILNFSALFICIRSLMCQKKKIIFKINDSIIFIFMLLLPCLCILPGAVELRFFVPMYLVVYGLLAYVVDYKKFWNSVRIHPIRNIIVFVGAFIVCCSIWGSTYALTEHGLVLSLL